MSHPTKQSVFEYVSGYQKKGVVVVEKFLCSKCGCKNCYRHKRDYHLTFFEGHFHCINCGNEASYATDDWEVKNKEKQLKLF
ncbi:MAG: hypothetical protein LC122_05230 [Chitinophagales bacterium]|nr:hypothetical protein [Chitinophagales bacterium]